MDKTYAIIWAATQLDRSGIGTRRFSKDEAEALANQLNEEHGEFLHRAIDMASEDPAVVLVAMRSTDADAAPAAQIVNFPDLVAAEAAAIAKTELLPPLDEKLVWLKPLLPVPATSAL
ncbi:MAG TPA: hypothetical protein VK615_17915 [Candidatus Binatia bacterium]|nr:hypothetical protein [Candidatus Binatia bacterium]